jgi:hypothetical protein
MSEGASNNLGGSFSRQAVLTQNFLRIPINITAGAGINTGQWYCVKPQIDDYNSPVIQICGKAWSVNGSEHAALAIKAPPAGKGTYNPVLNPNITVFKAKEARTMLPIQLNSTTPSLISQLVNPGNIFNGIPFVGALCSFSFLLNC